MQVEQPTKKWRGDSANRWVLPSNQWGAPHCHNFRGLHVLLFWKVRYDDIMNCFWVIIISCIKKERGSILLLSHNVSSSTWYNNQNRTQLLMHENDVWVPLSWGFGSWKRCCTSPMKQWLCFIIFFWIYNKLPLGKIHLVLGPHL